MTRATSLPALVALALLAGVPTAARADQAWPASLRLELGGGAGWSGRTALAGEGRVALRLGPLLGTAGASFSDRPSGGGPYTAVLGGVTAGLVRDAEDWECSLSALLAISAVLYPDQFGTGATTVQSPAIGLRASLGRYLVAPGWGGRLFPWLGLSATVAWSGTSRVRVLDQRHDGVVALVLVTVGAGAALPGAAPLVRR